MTHWREKLRSVMAWTLITLFLVMMFALANVVADLVIGPVLGVPR